MALMKWEPLRGIEKFFDDDWETMPIRRWGMGRMGWGDLAVDVFEEGDNVVAEMQLPGIDPEKVSVSVKNSVLRVFGQRGEEKEEKDKNYYRKEIRKGSFERMVRLPDVVNGDAAKAEYENGLLRVIVPKAKQPEDRKIKIQVKK